MAPSTLSFMPRPVSCFGFFLPMLDIEDSWALLRAPLLLLAPRAGFLSFPKCPKVFLFVGVGAKVRTIVFSPEAFLLFYPLPGVASFFFAAASAASAAFLANSIFFSFLFLFLSTFAYFYNILSCFINNNCLSIILSFGHSTALIASYASGNC